MALLVPSIDYDAVLASATDTQRVTLTLLTKLYASLPTRKRALDALGAHSITFAPQPEWDHEAISDLINSDLSTDEGDPFGAAQPRVGPDWNPIQQAENPNQWYFAMCWEPEWLEYAQADTDPDESAVELFLTDAIETIAIQIAVGWALAQPALSAAQRATVSAEFSIQAKIKAFLAWDNAHPDADA